MKIIWKHYVAELLGTLMVTLAACSAYASGYHISGVGLCTGLALTASLVTFGSASICGGNFNPAVSFATYVLRRNKEFDIAKLIITIISQMAGGIAGASICLGVFGKELTEKSVTVPAAGFHWYNVLLCEMIGTFSLALVCLFSSMRKSETSVSALVTGLSLYGITATLGSISGGSFNFARTLGSGLIFLNFEIMYVYLGAHILGALMASMLSLVMLIRNKEDEVTEMEVISGEEFQKLPHEKR